MSVKKKRGSYYTPDFLASFIMEYLAPNFQAKKAVSILEPSVGDGNFITAFNQTTFPESIEQFTFQAVEKIKPELEKAKEKATLNRQPNTDFFFIKNDFLKYLETVNRKFSLIAGNPPYIKKSFLNKIQIQYCKDIHTSAGLSEKTVKNIWTSFVVSCVRLLEDGGILAFVLPAELLQVKFCSSLRIYLSQKFERIETFTFDELMFHQIGQDTIVLICYKKAEIKGQFYSHIANRQQLKDRSFVLSKNDPLLKSEIKGTHHTLTSDEITLLVNLRNKLNPITSYCNSRPGIVTAANKFFIIDEETEAAFSLKRFTKRIIQKGLYVNGSVVFDKNDLEEIVENGHPTKLICFPEKNVNSFSKNVQSYFRKGKSDLIHERFKCLDRKKWFVVPNIAKPADGFFFKRSHLYPKLLKNEAQVLVTDSAYKVDMIANFRIEDLIFSFYNSLTLSFVEIEGRYYGGGVLELTPSEFKKLPVPYASISNTNFRQFREIFENKAQIEDVLKIYDTQILNTTLDLTTEDTEKIQAIRNKLIAKRLRK
jgi:adenine-specific DNA-methyltransferase